MDELDRVIAEVRSPPHPPRRRWIDWVADGWEWFTCDHPVMRLNYNGPDDFTLQGGWDYKGTDLVMPLSPRHLLMTQVGHSRPHRWRGCRRLGFGHGLRFGHGLVARGVQKDRQRLGVKIRGGDVLLAILVEVRGHDGLRVGVGSQVEPVGEGAIAVSAIHGHACGVRVGNG